MKSSNSKKNINNSEWLWWADARNKCLDFIGGQLHRHWHYPHWRPGRQCHESFPGIFVSCSFVATFGFRAIVECAQSINQSWIFQSWL